MRICYWNSVGRLRSRAQSLRTITVVLVLGGEATDNIFSVLAGYASLPTGLPIMAVLLFWLGLPLAAVIEAPLQPTGILYLLQLFFIIFIISYPDSIYQLLNYSNGTLSNVSLNLNC